MVVATFFLCWQLPGRFRIATDFLIPPSLVTIRLGRVVFGKTSAARFSLHVGYKTAERDSIIGLTVHELPYGSFIISIKTNYSRAGVIIEELLQPHFPLESGITTPDCSVRRAEVEILNIDHSSRVIIIGLTHSSWVIIIWIDPFETEDHYLEWPSQASSSSGVVQSAASSSSGLVQSASSSPSLD